MNGITELRQLQHLGTWAGEMQKMTALNDLLRRNGAGFSGAKRMNPRREQCPQQRPLRVLRPGCAMEEIGSCFPNQMSADRTVSDQPSNEASRNVPNDNN